MVTPWVAVWIAVVSPPEPVSFVGRIAPIFETHCFACHYERKKSGRYDMTRFESLAAGGVSGEPWVAGNPAESELVRLMTTDDDRRMPPRHVADAVPRAEADAVALWVLQGAKLDAGVDPGANLLAVLRDRWVPPAPRASAVPLPITALAFHPTEPRLVVGGWHELVVVAADTGAVVRRVPVRTPKVHALQFLPDGRVAVAGGRPGVAGEVTLVDLEGRTPPERLLLTDDSVLTLAVSGDGKLLAAAGCDRVARVWRLSPDGGRPELVATIESHTDWVSAVAFSPDGTRLATASRDKTAKVYDLARKESVATFPKHDDAVVGVRFTPDGKSVVSVGADRRLRTWPADGDDAQGKPRPTHDSEVTALARDPHSGWLFTSSADGTARAWTGAKFEAGPVYGGAGDAVTALAVSPDGTRLAAGSHSGKVVVFDRATGMARANFAWATLGRGRGTAGSR